MADAKRARTAETPKPPSLCLRLRALYFYPDHNLGLRHGGDENCNFKPNYNSVMNYRYQFPGVSDGCTPPGNGVLDYSEGTRIDLDELALDEFAGTCGTGDWDWNEDGVLNSPVEVDINRADRFQRVSCGATFTVLRDHDDWAHLNLKGIVDPVDGAYFDLKSEVEIASCHNPAPM